MPVYTLTNRAEEFTASSGADIVIALGGNDIVYAGSGADTVYGGPGDDEIYGEDGNDVLLDDEGSGWLYGGDGNDQATGAGTVNGGDGDDILKGGSLMFGGDGTDVLFGGTDYQSAGDGADTIHVTAKSRFVGGDAGDDLVVKNAIVTDRVSGGGGVDTLRLSGPRSEYRIDQINATQFRITDLVKTNGDEGVTLIEAFEFVEFSNEVYRLYGAGVASFKGGAADDVVYGGTGRDNFTGGGGDDSLTGMEGADLLFGGDGVDYLYGYTGDDFLDGGVGKLGDFMEGGAGADRYLADTTKDRISEEANGGIDTVYALANFSLADIANVENLQYVASYNGVAAPVTGTASFLGTGNGLANRITGGNNADSLDGGAGADVLVGLLGDDTYYVDHLNDEVVEAAGGGLDKVFAITDHTLAVNVEDLRFNGSANYTGTGNDLANRITGSTGADDLAGLGADDTLVGEEGNDRLYGGAGVDKLTGGYGNDLLNGGAGFDTLTGGFGADLFVLDFKDAASRDRIGDFQVGLDHVQIDGILFGLPKGDLAANKITFGTAASGPEAQFIYTQSTGYLSWDTDGSGKSAAVKLLQLGGSPKLTEADFIVA